MSDFSQDEVRILKLIAAGFLNAQGGGAKQVADDADLDGQYGDPEVKFSPRRWGGDEMKGRKMSQCPPAFLDLYADALQYTSEHPKEGKGKYAKYDARDAARARGWAQRLRSAKTAHAQMSASSADATIGEFDDELEAPF